MMKSHTETIGMISSTTRPISWATAKATVMDYSFYPVLHDSVDDLFAPTPFDVENELCKLLEQDDLFCDETEPDICDSTDSSESSLSSDTHVTMDSENLPSSASSASLSSSSPDKCDSIDPSTSWLSSDSHITTDPSFLPPSASTASFSSSSTPEDQRFKPFHEERWTLRYKELLIFHREHGHAAVPHTYPPNPQLARWIKRQRRQFKLLQDKQTSTMTAERLELLNDIEFVWDSHDVNWREKLDALHAFRKVHGNCNVPSNNKDKKLATWVKCQRRQYKLFNDGNKASSMTTERILQLEQLGFEWEIRAPSTRKNKPPTSNAPSKIYD